MKQSELFDVTVEAVKNALRECGPARMVREALAYEPVFGEVRVKGEKIGAGFSKIFLTGFGKCAAEMARGAVEVLGGAVDSGLLVSYREEEIAPGIKVLKSSHPLPGPETVSASRALVDFHAAAPSDSLIICLVSGGGSSFFEVPAPGVSIDDIVKTTGLLLSSEASIREINLVRKRLSAVKGGGLLAATKAKIVTLAICDVPGGGPADIASGPTFPEGASAPEAFAVLEKYELLADVPESVHAAVRGDEADADIPAAGGEAASNYYIVGDSAAVIDAISKKLSADGCTVVRYPRAMTGEMFAEALEFIEKLFLEGKRNPGVTCLIASAEMSVRTSEEGRGGRNQHFALICLKILQNPVFRSPNVAIAAIASDGVEAFTDSAGAFVSHDTAAIAEQKNIFAADYLGCFTSYDFFEKVGGHVRIGPTGHNVNDIVMGFYIN